MPANKTADESLAPSASSCWISQVPGGPATSHVPESNGSANGTYWLNAATSPSTTIKYTVKFLQNGTPIKKNVTQFSDTFGIIWTPFAFPPWQGNPHHGSALFVVKDSAGRCTFPFTVGGSVFESTQTKPTQDIGLTLSQITVSGIEGPVRK